MLYRVVLDVAGDKMLSSRTYSAEAGANVVARVPGSRLEVARPIAMGMPYDQENEDHYWAELDAQVEADRKEREATGAEPLAEMVPPDTGPNWIGGH